MSLRSRILSSTEIVSDLAWAGEQRFRDAEDLLVTGRHAGAVYLLGLAGEMWLKLACFRMRRATASTPVQALLGPARQWMSTYAPTVAHEGYHSLLFWTEYLIRWRVHAHQPMPRALAGELRHHVVARLFLDWKIELRYRSIDVSEIHAWRVYNDTQWLRERWDNLWR